MKNLFALLAILTAGTCLHAQTFGGHPPRLGWQQINTPDVRVIFPKGMERQAQRTASIASFMQQNNLRSVGDEAYKIDIVLQNQTVIPNGYVALAPFRSEFFSTPPQDPSLLGSLDWMDVLAVHEYRHVQQISNTDYGATSVLHALFGEMGWAAGTFLAIPNWYLEGDAVVAETAMTRAGRGRLPAFTLEQRALLLDDRRYAYMKARNGSFKDLLPNHYPLGYALCNYGRENYGNDIWAGVMRDAAKYRTIVYPFSGALKKRAGIRTPELYRLAYDSLATEWKAAQKSLNTTRFTKINRKKKRQVTHYNFPYQLSDGSTVCVRESFDKIANLVAISKDGKERRLTTQGIVIDKYISATNDKIAWSELETHPRWGNVFYSAIVTYDYRTGRKNRLTSKSKYFSPAYSRSGDKIAVVHVSENQQNEIRILDAATGQVLERLPNPGNHFLMYPQWTEDDRGIVFIDKKAGEMALILHVESEGLTTELTPYTAHVINTPHVHGDLVFFSASFSGIDNIFVVKMGEPGIRQVTSVKVGAYQPSVSRDGKTLMFSDFTAMGYDVARMPLEPSDWQLTEVKEPVAMYVSTAIEEEGGNILDEIPTGNFEVEKYRPPLGGLRLHSWLLGSENPNSLGITGILNNTLNTAAMTLGLGYNFNEERPEVVVSYQYGGFFPVLHFEGGFSQRQADFMTANDLREELNFNESRIGAGLSFPLQRVHGAYFTSLEISGKAFYRNIQDFKRDTVPVAQPGFDFASLDAGFSFYNLRKTAPQHIYSRFGQVVQASYQRGIDRSDIGRIRLLGRLYLPGLHSNHSIELEADYQEEDLGNAYQFGDFFEYARGYLTPVNDKVWRLGANYHFPIVYPDWGFGGLLYFRRIRGNVFYDQSRVWHFGADFDQRSYGGEMITDIQIFNLPVIASLGFRYARLLDDDLRDLDRKWRFEVFAGTAL